MMTLSTHNARNLGVSKDLRPTRDKAWTHNSTKGPRASKHSLSHWQRPFCFSQLKETRRNRSHVNRGRRCSVEARF